MEAGVRNQSPVVIRSYGQPKNADEYRLLESFLSLIAKFY
jgi:hypothetical protein